MEYKNFIPLEYIEKLKVKENNFFNKTIIVFMLVNLILLPKSIKKIYEDSKTIEVININPEIVASSNIELEEVLDLLDLNFIYLNIKDGRGIIRIKDREDIYIIDKYINIKSINKEEDGNYTLGVEL